MPFLDIAAAEVTAFVAAKDAVVLDMRDEQSFRRGHIAGARLITDQLIHELRRSVAVERPLLVYCYHGISSLDMASFLVWAGFRHVYNLQGGWQAWEQYQAGRGALPSPALAQWYQANGFSDAHPFARNERGLTPLMAAALAGDGAVVDELLGNEGVIDLVNGDGNTALWFACKSDSTEIM